MGRSRDIAVSEFRAKRKQPNQNKNHCWLPQSEKETDHEHFKKANQTCSELEQVTLKEHGLTLQQFVDEMGVLVSNNEDITEDIKTIRKALYDYVGKPNRFCTKCEGTGKTKCMRLAKYKDECHKLQTCSSCKGLGKKAKPCSLTTQRGYTVRFDKIFRHFGLFNRIDSSNLKFSMERKKQGKQKS